MKVHNLRGWLPRWQRLSSPSDAVTSEERGILIGTRWDRKTQSLMLIMEDRADRHTAVLEDKVRVLSTLSFLLDWHISRPIAEIGSLEIAL
jgi:hypothetical protein